jgi:hypothetical protein
VMIGTERFLIAQEQDVAFVHEPSDPCSDQWTLAERAKFSRDIETMVQFSDELHRTRQV